MLPSKKIYEEYSKSDGESDNFVKCGELTRKYHQYPDFNKLCRRLIMNIKKLNDKDNNDPSVRDKCKFLPYWMNDRVIKELKIGDDNNYIDITTKLTVAWFEFKQMLDNTRYICEQPSGPPLNLSVNDFKFRKEMYDYYYNYPKIKDWKFSNKNDCIETCKYLTSIKEIYGTFKSECSDSNNKCISDFKDFDGYDPIQLINQLGCNSKSKCGTVDVLAPDENLEGTPMAHVGESQDETVDANTQGYTEKSNSRTILNVALPASVFFVLFPMLYKMTPLGSRFGKANKIRNNIINDLKNEEDEYFLTKPFEQESMKNSDNTYNISYNNT
ncbi:Plasmodium vivax Vir protein, putative [Plasmodium vivax]|uniref:Vir protein, putative n=1 Tax=Plasmodium vivax TaxID=5855 RepID=A0A1G4H7W1_PLAVI|nr:Plasmodium vivax Vir protein, putative [Plasmodium vivax]